MGCLETPFVSLVTPVVSLFSDDVSVRAFPSVDSTENLLQLRAKKSGENETGSRPPRKKRAKDSAHPSDPSPTDEPTEEDENEEELDLKSNLGRQSDARWRRTDVEGDEEEMEELNRRNTKSVRWSDHSDGGSLSEVRPALSYNRRELSYQPKSRIKFGIWSPMQKKILIGVGIVILVILIVLFVVVFTVVKPSTTKSPPPLPVAPTAPFTKGQPSPSPPGTPA